jgi:MFS family permease
MQNMAGTWQMTHMTTSTVLIALMQTATSFPVFLLSIPSGALADIVDRRKLLLFTQSWMALAAVLLSVLTLSGSLQPWSLLGLTFLLGTGAALNNPAWQSLTPEIVSREDLPAAIALNGISVNLARATGPALGGFIISYYAVGYVFLINSLSFIGTLLAIYTWKRETPASNLPGERFLEALRAGIRYARFSRPVQAILIRSFAFTFGASAVWALLALIVLRRMGLGSGGYGVMLSWMGAGAITGALLLPKVSHYLPINWRVGVAITLFAATSFGLGFLDHHWLMYGTMFMGGIGWILVMASFNVSIQTVIPKWVQARAISMYMLVFQGGMAIGSVVWGTVADRYDLSTAMLVAAIWLLLSLLLGIPLSLKKVGQQDFTPTHHWPEPQVVGELPPANGPVIVMVEYHVQPQHKRAFMAAMQGLSRIRLRDGAIRVGVYADVADPLRMVEFFMVDSWAQHLRQHERFTQADREVESRVLQFHSSSGPPRVTHFVAAFRK